MTARTTREAIAAAIVLANIADLTVYEEPPNSVSSPSAVLGPGLPAREPSAVCAEVVRYTLTVTVARNAAGKGLGSLDDLIDQVQAAVTTVQGVTWERVNAQGVTLNIGGSDHLSASIDLRADI